MSWKERIQPASFKGVAFGVLDADKEGGRRTVVHEFPQRDEAYVEDLGGAINRFTVQAFVVGPDYMERRDELERVLNEPGPGALVHPWYGEITVSPGAPYKVKHSAHEGGMAVFTLVFVRDSAPASPAAGVNRQLRALDKADLAGALSCADFDAAFALIGQGATVAAQAYQAVTAAIGRVQAILGGDLGAIAGLIGDITGVDLLGLGSIGMRLWSAFQTMGDSGLARGISRADLAGAWLDVAGHSVPMPASDNLSATRERIAANEMAVRTLTRNLATVEAARSLALTVPSSRAEALALREAFVDILDAVLAAAPPDDLFAALVVMRAATLAALAEAASSAPKVIAATPAAVLPSLVLCYRLSGDIALDADLVARNRIAHPGFVPAARLEVLTYG